MSVLYNMIVGPLKLIFEIIYSIAFRVVRNPGLSIVFLSLAVNILVLPMYNSADRVQQRQKEIEKKLQPEIDHINRTFKGDEKYMMLQTFYRQNHYKPTDQLKGTISLLLQIPFFIAAYQFLSNLEMLKGVSFGPIRDLSVPDSMFSIGTFNVNVLPILMTVINLVSSFIYTRGSKLKDKIQLVAMALFFLVFLYTSPSGVVFYWTLNNLFSLLKNILLLFKNPGKILTILSTVLSPLVLIVVKLYRPVETLKGRVMVIGLCLVLLLPLIISLIKPYIKKTDSHSSNKWLFIIPALLCFVLVGLLIPSSVIGSSTVEFVDPNVVKNPITYVYDSAVLSAGFFLIWFTVFYLLTSEKNRWIFECFMCFLALVFVADYMLFGKNQSTLTTTLVFELAPKQPMKLLLLNLAVVVLIGIGLFVLFKKKAELISITLVVGVLAFSIMSVMNMVNINRDFDDANFSEISEDTSEKKYISLSKKGKNVVVIMLDRAIGPYIPYLFDENPDLLKEFAGFTYYPNSVSFGTSTNFGTPGLFGGYEYTPENMNKRNSESLKDKHNEALRVMPYIFDDNGFEVTVMDPPYANYSNISDLTIYNDRPEIHKYSVLGTFNNAFTDKDNTLRRNLFMYSVYKVVPMALQDLVYDSGNYHNSVSMTTIQQIIKDNYHSTGNSSAFNDSYYELINLSRITETTDDDRNTFMMMCNNVPHEPNMLQLPQYLPAKDVDNSQYVYTEGQYVIDGIEMKMQTPQQIIHYQSNMLAYNELVKWFDYLKKENVWDNTRIILVSDHGKDLYQFDEMIADNNEDFLRAACLLMVKDFGSKEYNENETFMTNADVPGIAFAGLISNPKNPFTGNIVKIEDKSHGVNVFFSHDFNVNTNNGNTFHPGPWYRISGNIYDRANWEYLGEH